ncbi:MAG: hypothetical protein RL291_259 [Pseudomonadota bacterium]
MTAAAQKLMPSTPPDEAQAVMDRAMTALSHSVTWEDQIWHADAFDVDLVHATARRRFKDVLDAVVGRSGAAQHARMILFHGQSGAGKTHLIRALRTSAHRAGTAYFGYAQMTPDVSNYADYFLRRLIASLEKPYDPDGVATETSLQRLTQRLIEDPRIVPPAKIETLKEAQLDGKGLARLVMEIADAIVGSPRFAEHDLDINIIRALLYLHREDPGIDQRIRQYLYGKPLTSMAHEAVCALDPTASDGRAFEIIESLGRLMWAIDRSALVFAIDQVEDLRFFDDYADRFQKAVRDLIQIANRLPSSIVLVSCLGDFYDAVRDKLAQSYVDRLEKSGPVSLIETRTADEARLIVSKRLEGVGPGGRPMDPEILLGQGIYEELSGLSTRRLLDLVFQRFKERIGHAAPAAPAAPQPKAQPVDATRPKIAVPVLRPVATPPPPTPSANLSAPQPSNLAAPPPKLILPNLPQQDFRELWERFLADGTTVVPTDDSELAGILNKALGLAREEWAEHLDLELERVAMPDDEIAALDMTLTHRTGFRTESRIFLCNKPIQGGGLKRQFERALATMGTKSCFMLRASEFPQPKKNQTAQAFRKFRESGGRSLVVPLPEWERMMMAADFHAHNAHDPAFKRWFEDARVVSSLATVVQLLRLDMLSRNIARVSTPAQSALSAVLEAAKNAFPNGHPAGTINGTVNATQPQPSAATRPNLPPPLPGARTATIAPLAAFLAQASPMPTPGVQDLSTGTNWGDVLGPAVAEAPAPSPEQPPSHLPELGPDDDLPLSVLLDENGTNEGSILAGRTVSGSSSVTLNKDVLRRHAAFLGGSGSGKTTLALCLLEQILARGTPIIMIDRKGDLCSYANPDVWRANDGEYTDRRAEREKLADQIDVAVYTPGLSSGRPISITLLPQGIRELPDHEQQFLANLSAAAIGDMLNFKNSATHQKLSGTLSVALRLLGQRSSSQVMLSDLIHILEEDDPELADATQRMDPSGRLRRDLVAQLDSLRHRNASLFEAGGETLNMERLLGIGPHKRNDGRTRLSIVYTGFLGDNENILFWVSQFLSEALRFCQRNPSDELQAILMLDEADLYIPANGRPATAEPLQSLLKRARSAGVGIMLATQSPGDLDYRSRDQITSWFIGRVREETALKKLKAAFQSDSGLDPMVSLPAQTVGEFHLVQEGMIRAMKSHRSLITAEQVPYDRIELLARETKGQDERQLKLFT